MPTGQYTRTKRASYQIPRTAATREIVEKIINLINDDHGARNLLLDMIAGKDLRGQISRKGQNRGQNPKSVRTRQGSGG